jgi:hypothetical protein
MANHGLENWSKPLSNWLRRVHNLAHLIHLLPGKFNITRCPILRQARGLGRPWDRNQALRSNPGQSDLRDRATLLNSQLLDLIDDSLVLVEVFALELGY